MSIKIIMWFWKKRQIFSIVSIILFVIILILTTKLPALKTIRIPVIQSTKELNKVKNQICILRECTLEEKQQYGQLFSTFPPEWSGCYGDFYLTAFNNENSSKYTLLDVGSNKAYAVATWLAFFIPKLNINQATLHHFLMGQPLTDTCGSCNDCKDLPLTRQNAQQNVTLDIHAFEPQPATTSVLQSMQKWMNLSAKDKSTLNIYGMAVSNYVGKVSFKKCNPGNEVCSLDVSRASPHEQVEIDAMTLDFFADKHNLSIIDVIKIDTEGYEPLVFQGAKRLLAEHRIRLFIFEHLKIATWLNTTLQIEISKFTKSGYICYIIGKHNLIRVSNCWNDKFAVQHNNLLCVSSKDRKLFNSIDQMRLNQTLPIVCEKNSID